MKNYVFAFLLGCLITLSVMKSINYFKPALNSADVVNIIDINSKLKYISENEYQDYLKLKDSEEKYKKADEILGKIMVLFLADLGLHFKSAATESINDSKPSLPVPEKLNSVVATANASAVAEPIKADSQVSLKTTEAKLLAAQTENDSLKILKELEIKDIESELKTAKPMTEKQLSLVKGKYVGVVNFDDHTEPWRIEWELNAEIVDGQVKGQQLITLSNSKKVFSRSRGNGNIKDFMAFAGDSSAILINSYGDDGYIQLYPLTNTGKIFGNYYLREKGSFRKIGIVLLDKVL